MVCGVDINRSRQILKQKPLLSRSYENSGNSRQKGHINYEHDDVRVASYREVLSTA